MDSQTVTRQQTVQDPPTAGKLKSNALGVVGILFFVLSAQAPLTGIAGALPISVGLGNGAGAPAGYAVAGAVIFLFSVGFVAMGRHVVDAGAFYTYIGRGLGRTTGTGSAGVALFAYCTIQAAMYGLYGSIVSGLVAQYTGLDAPWWVWAVVTMVIVQVLGAAGIEMGAKVLAVFVLAEFSILLVFALVTLVKGGGPEGLGFAESFSPKAALQGAPGVALMFAVASMFGFEATAIYGEEAREPKKTVPRATYLSVAVVTGFFAFTSWMLVSAYGASHATAAMRQGAGGRRRRGVRPLARRGPVRRLGGRRPAGPARHLALRHPRLPQLRQPLPVLARPRGGAPAQALHAQPAPLALGHAARCRPRSRCCSSCRSRCSARTPC